MNIIPESILSHKMKLENHFKLKNVDCDFKFELDPDSGGYCFMVMTDYGIGIFSDHNDEKELKMFILKNSVINYANCERLTDEQFSTLKSCVESPTMEEFVFILTNPVQPKLKFCSDND